MEDKGNSIFLFRLSKWILKEDEGNVKFTSRIQLYHQFPAFLVKPSQKPSKRITKPFWKSTVLIVVWYGNVSHAF